MHSVAKHFHHVLCKSDRARAQHPPRNHGYVIVGNHGFMSTSIIKNNLCKFISFNLDNQAIF